MKKYIDKKTLTPVDIVGYLPHEIKIKLLDGDIGTATGISNFKNRHNHVNLSVSLNKNDRCGRNYILSTCKLILHPMSDLYKPMTHPDINNGEKFIPIVEIAKLLNPYSGTYELGKWTLVNSYSDGSHYESVRCFDECAYEYYYLTYYDRNNHIQRLNRECFSENIMYPNVIELLNKLHFDYNNFIGQGLAIDINTLKNSNDGKSIKKIN